MAIVPVVIGGRSYSLACRDGEEPRLRELAAFLDVKAGEVSAGLGAVSEQRLLLMAGILAADELFELRATGGAAPAPLPAPSPAPPYDAARLEALVARAEAIADALERGLGDA